MRENRSSGFLTRSDTNQPVQSQKTARSFKFQILEEEELHYLCSENKGADQLCSYCTADLRLCFRIGNNPIFSQCGSYVVGDEVNRWSILFEAVIWRWLIQGTIQPVLAVIVGLIGCPLVSLGVIMCKY